MSLKPVSDSVRLRMPDPLTLRFSSSEPAREWPRRDGERTRVTWLTPSRKLCNVTTEGRREGWREEVVELPNPLHWAVEEPGARDDDAAETTEAARELSPVCDRCGFDGRRRFELSGR